MAKELLPDALWLRIAPLIPPEAPKPKGGPPCVGPGSADRDPVRAEDRYCLGFLGQPVLLDIQLVRTVNLDSRAWPPLN